MRKSLDKILAEFEEKTKGAESSFRPLWEGTDADDIYSVDIHVWRKPGMGNSLQTIAGNKISIMTATASYLETLVKKGVLTYRELDTLFEMVQDSLEEQGIR